MLGTLNNLKIILNRDQKHKWKLCFTYFKLSVDFFFLHRILKTRIKQQRIFDQLFFFNDYATFLFIFEEIFVQQQYYFNTSKTNPTIIDCGSNIGLSILFFKIYYPDATIIGFEPDYNTFQLLKKNIEQNNLKGIQLVHGALYNQKGNIPFHTVEANTGTLVMSTRKERLDHVATINVQALLLSEFIVQQIDFLKMDIEGAETLVLQEMVENGKLFMINEMCIEYHHHITSHEDNLSSILNLLEKNNFGYQIINGHSLSSFAQKEVLQDIIIRAYKKTGRQ